MLVQISSFSWLPIRSLQERGLGLERPEKDLKSLILEVLGICQSLVRRGIVLLENYFPLCNIFIWGKQVSRISLQTSLFSVDSKKYISSGPSYEMAAHTACYLKTLFFFTQCSSESSSSAKRGNVFYSITLSAYHVLISKENMLPFFLLNLRLSAELYSLGFVNLCYQQNNLRFVSTKSFFTQ